MKLILFALLLIPTICTAQLVFEVNAPSIERGVFPCMAGSPSDWTNSPDLYQDGSWFSDTLILADDGLLGSACSPLNNAITSNFALFYRSGCPLGECLLNAQNAGATAAIVIDSVDGRPLPFEPDGLSPAITIPFVIISRGKGDSLIQRIAENEAVVVSFGDKTGINTNDIGIYKEFSLWSRYGIFPFGEYELPDDHFGTWVYNHGTTDAANLQVKLWFYHDPNYPQHNQDSLSMPFDLAAGDSVFINFDFEYDHMNQGYSIQKANPLNYGYELLNVVDDDTLDNKIRQIIYSEDKLISNSFSPSSSNTDFSEVDYFIEGSTQGFDSLGYCLYMPIKITNNVAFLCDAIAPMVGTVLGAEQLVYMQDVIIGNQQATFDNFYDQGTYGFGNPNDSVYSDFYLNVQQPIAQNTDLVACVITSLATRLGFTSDMYHDEQIRQGYLPTYFRKAPFSTDSSYDPQYYLTPILSFDMWYYSYCVVGITEEIENPHTSLFPNPTTNNLTIQSTGTIETITVFDVFGKKVLSIDGNGGFKQTVDVEGLNAGCYLVEVLGDERSVGRFLKE